MCSTCNIPYFNNFNSVFILVMKLVVVVVVVVVVVNNFFYCAKIIGSAKGWPSSNENTDHKVKL